MIRKNTSRLACLRWIAGILAVPIHLASSAEDTIRVVRLGPDQQRVEIVSTRLKPSGDWMTETNGYSELGTGLNYWSDTSQRWEASREVIEITEAGAVAIHAPHKVIFAPTLDDPHGTVDILAPGGGRFRSSVLSVGYHDPISGHRFTLGLVKDVPGELLPPNQVIYRDAFESQVPGIRVRCDVLYTFRRWGIEQDILVREPLPPPEEFGFSGDWSRLEVMTEFFEAPEPKRNTRLLDRVEDVQERALMASPDWEDESLDFGQFLIGDGRAFRLGRQADMFSDGPNAPMVAKRWVVQDGRNVLLEGVRYAEVEPMLRELMAGSRDALGGSTNQVADLMRKSGIQRSSPHQSCEFELAKRDAASLVTGRDRPASTSSLRIATGWTDHGHGSRRRRCRPCSSP